MKVVRKKTGGNVLGKFIHIIRSKVSSFSKFDNRKKAFILLPLCLVMVATLFLIARPKVAKAAWYSSSWSYRIKLSVDKSKVSGSSTLTDFPVLVSITNSSLQANAQSDADDILFTSANGQTKLDHEIESYTSASGILVAWVRIPSLLTSANTDIFMYYGNASATSQQNKTGVWDSNYRLIWHMSDTSGQHLDSSSKVHNSTSVSVTTQGSATGKVGGADDFNGTTNTVTSPDHSDYNSSTATIQTWVKFDQLSSVKTTDQFIIDKINSTSPFLSAVLRFIKLSDTVQACFTNISNTVNCATSSSTLSASAWYHLVAVYDGSNISIYINGALNGTPAALTGTLLDSDGVFRVSGDVNPANFTDGIIDEVRYSGTNRSADWIATEYNNQSSPSTFLTTGQVEQNISSVSNIPPVLYWNFDEGYGTTVNDVSGYSNSGTLGASTAAPTIQTEDMCMSGKCLKFDGSNDYVSRTYSSDTELNPGTGSFSVSAWFRHKPSVPSGTEYLVSRISSGGYGIWIETGGPVNGRVCFGIDDDATWSPDDQTCSTTALYDNSWHFIEAVKNGTSNIQLFIDGKLVNQNSSLTATGSLSGSSPTFYAGVFGNGTSNPLDGFLDEIKYFNYAKSSSQVLTDFESKGNTGQTSTTFGVAESNTSLSNGLVGYWKMDESTANTCTNDSCDSSGNANDGAWNGNTVNTTGKFSNGTIYDGTGDYTNITSSTSMQLTSQGSLSAWVYMSATPDNQDRFITHSQNNDFWIGINSTNFTAFIYDGSGVYAQAVAYSSYINTWVHITGTFDGKRLKLYVNGVLSADASAGSINYEGGDARSVIGSYADGTGGYLTGKVDDARLYNRALSNSEILTLYDWAPNPVGHWKMDEGTGTTANDVSGNGNSGTFTNSGWMNCKYGNCMKTLNNSAQDIVTVTDPASDILDFSNLQSFTYETWIKSSNKEDATHPLRKGGTSSSVVGYYIQLDTGNQATCAYTDGNGAGGVDSATSTSNIQDGSWHHIACVMDRNSSAFQIFIDGKLEASDASLTEGSAAVNTNNLIFGETSVSREFEGGVDDVRIYNYSRTSKQIVSDMNGGHPSVGSPIASALGHWKFDEGAGVTANNSGNGGTALNGTLTNFASPATSTSGWSSSGKFNKALNFEPTNDYVTIPDNSSLEGFTNISLCTWVYPRTTPDPSTNMDFIIKPMHVAGAAQADPYALYGLSMNSSQKAVFAISTGISSSFTTVTSANSINLNAWNHVCGIYDNQTMKTYINGVLDVNTTASTITIGTNSIDLRLGAYMASSGKDGVLNGLLDEVKIYNYALNADEVKLDMNQGKSTVVGGGSTNSTNTGADSSNAREYCVPGDTATCTAPTAEWKFDEKTGTSVLDSTGGNATGTLTNTTNTNWISGKKSNAIDFDNVVSANSVSNQYADLGDTTTFDGATALTFSSWIYIDTLPTGGNFVSIVRKDGSFTPMQLAGPSDGQPGMRFIIWLAGINVINDNDLANWPTKQWVHFAGTWTSGGKIKLYRNGINYFTSASTYTGSIANSANSLRFGATEANAEAYDGKMDQTRYWNRELTSAQIAWDYNRGAPTAWWKFDECQGTVANDSSGNSNTGTITLGGSPSIGNCSTSSTTWANGATGKLNGSLSFDGTDDYVSVNDSTTTRQASSFSISAWAYFNSANSGDYIIEKGTAGTANYYIYWWPGQGLDCGFHGGGNWIESDYSWTPTTSTWYHITCVFDDTADTIKTYVNNALVKTSTSITAAPDTGANNTYIGRSIVNNDYSMDGKIDDVRLYNYPLTFEQIKLIYNNDAAARFNPSTGSP
jgi:hypothetical protein